PGTSFCPGLSGVYQPAPAGRQKFRWRKAGSTTIAPPFPAEIVMRNRFLALAFVFFAAPAAHAAMVATPVDYEVGGKKMQSMLVYDSAVKTPRPGLVMVPD